MRVNHINLQVSDVNHARTFFETNFGMECKFQRRDELAIMDDGESEVRSTYERLVAAGVEMKTEVSRGGPNVYFMCFGPERIMIEVRGPADAH